MHLLASRAAWAALGAGLAVVLGVGTLAAALADRPWAWVAALVVAGAWCALERARPQARAPASAAGEAGPWARLTLAVVLSAVAVAAWPALSGDFLGDDFGYVQLFEHKSWASFVRLGDISEGLWGHPLDELRPLFALSFKLGLALHGPVPRGFLATNLVLHLVNCALLYRLVRLLAPGRRGPAAWAALSFGMLGVHAEPLAWVTGKVDVLPTCFYLATCVAFARFRTGGRAAAWWAALGLYGAGIFTKEVLLTLPAVLLLGDLWLERWGAGALDGSPGVGRPAELLRVHAPFLLVAGGFLVLRRLLFASFAREGQALWPRAVAFAAAQPEKLRWLLFPDDLAWSAAFGPPAVVRQCALGAAAGLAGGVLVAAWWRARQPGAAEARRALDRAAFFALGWYGLTLLPLLVTYPSARHLYLPSCGPLLALAFVLWPSARETRARHTGRWMAALAFAVLQAWLLRETLHPWVSAGEFSRRARAGLSAALGALPPGSAVVLAGLPASRGPVVWWKFALPFALQPPFVERAVDTPLSILASPGLHARPLEHWWQLARARLQPLLEGPADERLDVYLVRWNDRRERVVTLHARPTRGLLRMQVQRVLGPQPLPLQPTPQPHQAEQLLAELAEVLRHTPAD